MMENFVLLCKVFIKYEYRGNIATAKGKKNSDAMFIRVNHEDYRMTDRRGVIELSI